MTEGMRKWRRALFYFLVLVAAALLAFFADIAVRIGDELIARPQFYPALQMVPASELASLPLATRFDFPLGSEHGAMAYNAQRFTENKHLGDDLNGIGGEDSDLGDPIYAVADGRVLLARDAGSGWGNVIIVLHAIEENGGRKYMQSFYGHVETMLMQAGDEVRRGQQIATVGTADGRYPAHLHFEMREFVTPFVGPGYRENTRGWLDPTAFIKAHRGAPEDDVGRALPAGSSA